MNLWKIISAFLIFFITSSSQAEINRLLQIDNGLWRGSQPTTEEDYLALKKLGVEVIINLRWDDSVASSKATAQRLGFKFYNFPMNARQRPDAETIQSILKLLDQASERATFFHCREGKDRTGLIAALYRVNRQKWDSQKAYDEWVSMGFSYKFLAELRTYFWDHVPAVWKSLPSSRFEDVNARAPQCRSFFKLISTGP